MRNKGNPNDLDVMKIQDENGRCHLVDMAPGAEPDAICGKPAQELNWKAIDDELQHGNGYYKVLAAMNVDCSRCVDEVTTWLRGA